MAKPYFKAWGDSLTQNSSGGILDANRWTTLLMARFRVAVANQGIGGETSAQIYARMLLDEVTNRADSIIWAGRNGVLTLTPEAIMATLQQMKTWHGPSDRFVFVSVIPYADGSEPPGSPERIKIDTLNSQIQAAWPDNYLDVVEALNDPATRGDGLHLNTLGTQTFATILGDWIESRRWASTVIEN